MKVYHFTDTARLLFILHDGALRPGRNTLGGYPSPEFVWATTDDRGEPSAAGQSHADRAGRTRLVRFTLRATDFEPWPDITASYPAWTPEQIARLERSAPRGSDPSRWQCRVAPLARD